MTEVELKAKIYDCMVVIEQAQQTIRQLNEQLRKLNAISVANADTNKS